MTYVLGVDGGNTKTIALVARLDGTIVGQGRGGCADVYGGPSPEAALEEITHAVTSALVTAGIHAETLVASAFSMAGADWPEDFAYLQAAMERNQFGQKTFIVNDAIGALRAGSPDGTGVVVACGSGTATGARNNEGQIWHSSFWQGVHGGRQLGYKTLEAVYRAELGIDPPTTLTTRVLEFFDEPTVESLLYRFTNRLNKPPERREVGGLARILLDEADSGDQVARAIVEAHGTGLGDYALVAAQRVGIADTRFPLVLTGGVLRHPGRMLADAIIARVHTVSPEAYPVMSRFEPVVGALFLAYEQTGVAIDDALLERLVATLPAADLFTT
jgi:N-acetylglucosamine kinase-like BadF-type ATPase